MAVKINNFNRIIDLTFYTAENGMRTINCPRHGRKPSIEINGTFTAALTLQAFHITIKNLYFDLRVEQYTRVKVRAGYANNAVAFEANILNMYQQSPGPDGTTVVECLYGKVTGQWLSATVDLNYEAGTKVTEVMDSIKTKLKASDTAYGDEAKKLELKEPLEFEGSAREALNEIVKRCADNNLQIFMRGDKLCAVCLTEGDCIEEHELNFMSAPPQQNPGDENGNWTTQITAPWMPEVLPGDNLRIPLQTYIRNGVLVGGGSKKQTMHIIQMSFHFGTGGSVNQMTCSGYIKRK
jgi:hypothetical protein